MNSVNSLASFAFFAEQSQLAALGGAMQDSQWVLDGTVSWWHDGYLEWMAGAHGDELDADGYVATEAAYYGRLRQYLDSAGAGYNASVEWSGGAVVASKLALGLKEVGSTKQVAAMRGSRSTADDAAGKFSPICYHVAFLFFEGCAPPSSLPPRMVALRLNRLESLSSLRFPPSPPLNSAMNLDTSTPRHLVTSVRTSATPCCSAS